MRISVVPAVGEFIACTPWQGQYTGPMKSGLTLRQVQRGEEGLHVGRRRGGEAERLPGAGVAEAVAGGVQGLAGEIEQQGAEVWREGLGGGGGASVPKQ